MQGYVLLPRTNLNFQSGAPLTLGYLGFTYRFKVNRRGEDSGP
jgi:hypothetical protein